MYTEAMGLSTIGAQTDNSEVNLVLADPHILSAP